MRMPVAERRRRLTGALVAAAVVATVSACADDDAAPVVSTAAVVTATTLAPSTTMPASSTTTVAPRSTTTTTATTTTTTRSSTTTSPTIPPAVSSTVTPTTSATPDAVDGEVIELGTSVEGRTIVAVRRGTPGGTAVLAIGVIHGDEDDGEAIVDLLVDVDVPEGVELWLVPSMNPDGQAAQVRHNANGVDLNRNFPERWGPIAGPGDWQYAGPGPASEPETQAMVALAGLVRPDLTLWYHQDLFRINPASGRDGEVRRQYADLTGLPIVEVSGGTYTGTASQWSRTIAADDGLGFTVELGPTLTADEAARHAAAVLAVAASL
jgi:protein MpaA